MSVARPIAPERRAFDLGRHGGLGTVLRDAVDAHRSLPFLVETDRGRVVRRLGFGDFGRDVSRLSRALAARGVGPGERVGLLLGNGPRWLTGAAAVLGLGAVLVPVDARADAAEQGRLLAHSGARTLLTDGPAWRRLRDQPRPRLEQALVAEPPGEGPPGARRAPDVPAARDGAWRWDEALDDAGDGPWTPVPGDRDAVAAIVYSSGTGGRPKGCLLTHGAYLAQLEVLARVHPLEPGDVYLSVLPTSHAIDFMCGFLVPALSGATVVHLRTLRPEWITGACRAQGVTHLAAVPALLQALERGLRERLDGLPPLAQAGLRGARGLNAWLTRDRPREALSRLLLDPVHRALGGRLARIFAGGAFVPRATARSLWELGLPVAIGYGLTEACAVVTVNDLQPFRDDTVGAPLPGTEVSIGGRDRHGVGEVLVRGPQLFQGYLDDPELTAATFDEGWLRTGDLGCFDATGHLKLAGRRKHMVVTPGGLNVYPEDVEARFDGLPVDEHAVLAAHACWPARPGDDEALVLVVRGRGDVKAEVAARNRGLLPHQRLAGLLVVDEPFPRTTSLKLRRDDLARRIGGQRARADVVAL